VEITSNKCKPTELYPKDIYIYIFVYVYIYVYVYVYVYVYIYTFLDKGTKFQPLPSKDGTQLITTVQTNAIRQTHQHENKARYSSTSERNTQKGNTNPQ